MITLAFALLAAAQAAAPAVPIDTTPTPWPDPERERDGATYKVDTEARTTMARYAACVADKSADKVNDLLVRDFRTSEYRSGLKNLVRANEDCARLVGMRGERMRSGDLPFAAGLAEAMMRKHDAPLNVRLAKAAAGKEAPTFAPSDKIAMCVARSAPDEVAKLFATDPDSQAETEAVRQLSPVVKLCGQGVEMQSSVAGLRGIVATASFRLLAAQEG